MIDAYVTYWLLGFPSSVIVICGIEALNKRCRFNRDAKLNLLASWNIVHAFFETILALFALYPWAQKLFCHISRYKSSHWLESSIETYESGILCTLVIALELSNIRYDKREFENITHHIAAISLTATAIPLTKDFIPYLAGILMISTAFQDLAQFSFNNEKIDNAWGKYFDELKYVTFVFFRGVFYLPYLMSWARAGYEYFHNETDIDFIVSIASYIQIFVIFVLSVLNTVWLVEILARLPKLTLFINKSHKITDKNM